MATRVLPYVESMVITYLLTRTEVTNLVGGPPASSARIGTELDLTSPASLPALRVRRISTTSPVRRHLRAGNCQLEAWASSETLAEEILETALGVLHEDGFPGTYAGLGVVTGVDDSLGSRPLPDPDTGTPRWLGSVIVYAHPIPE